jgi:membrane associated rhomboid family serine protease
MNSMTVALFVAIFLFVSHIQGDLHAYLDPGTGSLAIQLLLGGIVAGLATARLYWQRMKTFFLRRRAAGDGSSEPAEPVQSPR